MSHIHPPEQKGLIIGPLRHKQSADQSAVNVFQLLMAVGLKCSDISRVYINPKARIAKIELYQKDCEDYLVRVLKEVRSIMSLYNLRKLLENPEQLVVVRIRQLVQAQHYQDISNDGTSTYRPTAGEIMLPLPENQQPEASESYQPTNEVPVEDITLKNPTTNFVCSSEGTSSMEIEFEELDEEETSKSNRNEATSTSNNIVLKLTQTKGQVSSRIRKSPMMISVKTSTPIIYPCGCPDTVFYRQFQHIGTETRYAEFKKGGIIHEQKNFRNIIAKYVCGFLNTEGGALYLGVDDEGKVLGIEVDAAMEKILRSDIDFAIRLIEPNVEKSEYSVNFARIMELDGEFSLDLKVLELCVKPRIPPVNRYSYNGVVYIRRDGSLQALRRENIIKK